MTRKPFGKPFISALLLAGILGCVSCSAQQTSETPAEAFEKAITSADAARKKAASVGGEWRDTGKLIKKARAAAEKGDYEKAVKLANTAKMQGEAGYQQAMDQKDAGLPSYLTK